MPDNITKRIVVIKDIPSNVIEEAILILKSDPRKKSSTISKDTDLKKVSYDSSFMLKEAYMVINEFIRNNTDRKIDYKGFKSLKNTHGEFFISTVINATLIGSIALLIFMLTKLL